MKPTSKPPPTREGVFTDLLADGIAALHFDARAQAVRVPAWLRARSWLVLNFSYGYNLVDFVVDADGVGGSLSFSGQPFACWVPWQAVFAVTNESRSRQWMWLDAMPPQERERAIAPEVLATLTPGAILEQTAEGVTLHAGPPEEASPQQPTATVRASAPPTPHLPMPLPRKGRSSPSPVSAKDGGSTARSTSGLRLVRGGRDDDDHRRDDDSDSDHGDNGAGSKTADDSRRDDGADPGGDDPEKPPPRPPASHLRRIK